MYNDFALSNHPLIHRFLVYIIQLQLLKIFWPYFGELATEKNACVCFARMSFVTPHIFLGLASFHFLVISDRFISKQRSGIPSTLGEICTTHNIHIHERVPPKNAVGNNGGSGLWGRP